MRHRKATALVRGYQLEVPAVWARIPEAQREALQNGIGPERWPPERRRWIDSATGFRAVADVHDVYYATGRTSRDRKAADRQFLRNCLRVMWADCLRDLLGAWRHPAEVTLTAAVWFVAKDVLLRLLVAWAFYRVLRDFGGSAFQEGTKLDLRVRGAAARPVFDDGRERA